MVRDADPRPRMTLIAYSNFPTCLIRFPRPRLIPLFLPAPPGHWLHWSHLGRPVGGPASGGVPGKNRGVFLKFDRHFVTSWARVHDTPGWLLWMFLYNLFPNIFYCFGI